MEDRWSCWGAGAEVQKHVSRRINELAIEILNILRHNRLKEALQPDQNFFHALLIAFR